MKKRGGRASTSKQRTPGRPVRASRRDVAREAGVSQAAVSYVINGKARENRISDETAERIRKVAKRLGYTPNVYGKVLKARRSNVIVFVSVDVTDPNTVEIIVTPNPGTREEPYQCENRIGHWEALSTLFKLKPPKIEHPECLFKGGNTCRYIVSWQKSPVTTLKASPSSGCA